MVMDERATLTNMAVEAGSFTGIIEADETAIAYLEDRRPESADELRVRIVKSDPDAVYCKSAMVPPPSCSLRCLM